MKSIIHSIRIFGQFAAGVLALAANTAGQAGIVTVPPGLTNGQQYRLAFVTSGTITGTIVQGGPANIAAYNSFATASATNVAELNALGTTWKAVVSFREDIAPNTQTLAKDNTGTAGAGNSVPIYNLAGLLVAGNNADLWDGSIAHPINVMETGLEKAANTHINTGTLSGGGSGTDYWMGKDPGGNYMGLGDVSLIDAGWVAHTRDAGTARPIYVMSGILTASSTADCNLLTFNWGSYVGVIDGTNVTLVLPNGTDVTALNPTCTVSPGAAVSPPSGGVSNFTGPVNYSVAAQDGIHSRIYQVTVTVSPPGTACDLLTFNWGAYYAMISDTNVTLVLPNGTDVSALNPTCAVSPGATVSPVSGSTRSFTNPQSYTITAGNGTTSKSYTVTVVVGWVPPGLDPGDDYRLVFVTGGTRDATSQNIADYNAFVTSAATAVPALNALNTTWKCIGSTAAVNANANTLTRATDPSALIYRMDGTLVAAGNADLWDGGIAAAISITETGNSKSAQVWTGTMDSGVRNGDWCLGDTGGGWVYYGLSTGTGDGAVGSSGWVDNLGELKATSKSLYAISGILTIPGNSAKCDLLTFNWGACAGVVTGTDVALTVPFGTHATALNPTCTISSKATVTPVSGSTHNFTNPVDYTVTAQDGTSARTYTVTVTVAPPSTACDMLTFGWGNQSSTVAGTGFIYYVPRGTSLTAFSPTMVLSPGATVSPALGSPRDFSNTVTYTVTAQDGITRNIYHVTVAPDPLILRMDLSGDKLVFTWNSQDGMAYDITSTDNLAMNRSSWNVAQGGILPTLGGTTTTTTLPRPAAPKQFYVLEEYADTQVAWDAASGHLNLTYGTVRLDGMVSAENAGGQPVPGYQVQFDTTETPGGVNVEQLLNFVPVTPQAGVKIVFRGTVSGSPQAFPLETRGVPQARFPYVRNSVGLSRNLRNNAIFDRYHDWVVIGPDDGATLIQPATVSPQGITFSWESRATSLQLKVHPRYYREHLGLSNFDPARFHPSKESITGYCTWWAYKYDFTQNTLDSLVNVFGQKHLPDFGYHFIQIDDTYQTGNGSCPQNWLTWNSKFPGGAPYAAGKIRSIGMKPGIWVHRVHRPSDPNVAAIGVAHPDWFVTNPDGSLFNNSGFYCLNTHNEAALDGMARPTYRALRQQGWDYVKIDGAGDLLNSYNGAPQFFAAIGSTPAATFRIWDQVAREELGPNTYILSCWGVGPGLNSIGLVDGCRLDGDGFSPASLLRYNSWNGVVWRNDPDHCDILAEWQLPKTRMNVFATGTAMADTVERPCIVSMAGGVLMVSDLLETYQVDSNLEGMKRSSPILFTQPGQLYNYDAGDAPWWLLEIDRPFDHWSVLAHFNPRQQSGSNWPRPGTPTSEVRFADLGLYANREYLVFEFWTQTFIGKFTGSFTAPAMDTNTAVQIFSIREARAYPWVISTTRHISQGGVGLLDESWDPATNTLSGQSAVIIGDPFVLTTYLPAGFRLASASVGGEAVTISNQTSTAAMRLVPSATGTVPWQMTFTK